MANFPPVKGPERQHDYSAVIENLLAGYDLSYRGAGEFRSRCPFHDGDNPLVFRVRQYGRYYNCFSCGVWGWIEKLAAALLHLNPEQVKLYLASAPQRKADLSNLALPPRGSLGRLAESPALREASIAPYKVYCPESLLVRGFSADILQKYEIGYDMVTAKAVLPLRDVKQRLVGLTYRVDYDWLPEEAKYWHDHFDKTEHVYGLSQWVGKSVGDFWTTEGNLDPVRLHQLDTAGGAVMGTVISPAQLRAIRGIRFSRFVLGLDNDRAGKAGTRRAIRQLVNEGFGKRLVVPVFPDGVKDPGELRSKAGVTYLPWLEWLEANPPPPPIEQPKKRLEWTLK